jgi:excisionase family DNA binding protein
MAMDKMERQLYNVGEVAELLGISRAKLYSMIRAGAIESVKMGGSRRIPAQAIERFLAELRSA